MAYRTKKLKYGNHKNYRDGIKFDSDVEAKYYTMLKNKGVEFKCHESFYISSRFKAGTKTYGKRRYTPDFSIYENGELIKVVDVKGNRKLITDGSSLRMNFFMEKYRVPVMIAVFKNGSFVETQK